MPTYAARTDVSSEKSQAEVKRIINRYGARQYAYMEDDQRAVVAFVAHDRQVRFILPLPDRTSTQFTRTPTGKVATQTSAENGYEQAIRQRWRALALVIKAKLEAVEAGITTFEQEFFAHTVLPSGRTVFEEAGEQVNVAISTGSVRSLMIESGVSR